MGLGYKLLALSRGKQLESKVELPYSSSSDTKPSTLPDTAPDYLSLGAKPKTSTSADTQPSSSSTSSSTNSYSENLIVDFGTSVKHSFRDRLYQAFHIRNNKKDASDNKQNDEKVLNELIQEVSEISVQTFKTEAHKKLWKEKIPISPRIQKDIEYSSNSFAKSMKIVVNDTFKQGIINFEYMLIPKNFDPIDPITTAIKVSNNYGNSILNLSNEHLQNSLFNFIKVYK